jgi:hypothetical protein
VTVIIYYGTGTGTFINKTFRLFFGNKCPVLKSGKENIRKTGLMKLLAGHIYTTGIYFYVEPDIRYPALPVPGTGYPVSSF